MRGYLVLAAVVLGGISTAAIAALYPLPHEATELEERVSARQLAELPVKSMVEFLAHDGRRRVAVICGKTPVPNRNGYGAERRYTLALVARDKGKEHLLSCSARVIERSPRYWISQYGRIYKSRTG